LNTAEACSQGKRKVPPEGLIRRKAVYLAFANRPLEQARSWDSQPLDSLGYIMGYSPIISKLYEHSHLVIARAWKLIKLIYRAMGKGKESG
jgi:hypothetical protein